MQKSPCQDGAWQNNVQYTRFCYTDVLALYYAEGLNEGKVPYRDHPVEYPVLTGYFMGALGLPVHALGVEQPGDQPGPVVLQPERPGALRARQSPPSRSILALRRRRPWDAALFALVPVLLLTATVNWDLLAVGLAAFGLLAWARRRPVLAGVLLGLGGAAKMWPLFILGPLLVLGAARRPVAAALTTFGTAVVTWPWSTCRWPSCTATSWDRFFELNTTRPIDWGTFWYIGRYLDGKWNTGSAGDRGRSSGSATNIPTLNLLSYGPVRAACLGSWRWRCSPRAGRGWPSSRSWSSPCS